MYDIAISQEWFHLGVIYDESTFGQSLLSQFRTLVECLL